MCSVCAHGHSVLLPKIIDLLSTIFLKSNLCHLAWLVGLTFPSLGMGLFPHKFPARRVPRGQAKKARPGCIPRFQVRLSLRDTQAVLLEEKGAI